MPPTRRRPPANQPPARRPKVAGLRRPPQTDEHPERPEELTQRIERVRDEPKPTPATRPRPRPAPSSEPEPKHAWTEPEPAEQPRSEDVARDDLEPKTYRSGLAARRAARAAADEPEPESEPAEPTAESAEAVEGVEAEEKPAGRKRTLVLGALAAATVVFGGLAAFFGVMDHNLTSGVVAGNTALTDTATTSQISGQVTSAINTMFSYDYQNVDKTKQAAQKLLVGKAVSDYNNLFKTVEQEAPQQKLVLTTSVVDVGVQMIQGDRASALVFANQTDVRASDNSKASGGTMFSVQLVQQGGQWKISSIDTFNSTS